MIRPQTRCELAKALLTSRTFCLTDWARHLAPRRPPRTPRPRHRLRHRLKRMWRWMAHARREPVALQLQALPWLWQALGRPRRWVVAVDWTHRHLTTVQGKVLAVLIVCPALLGRHRALPLSQNRMESTLLAALLAALPSGVEVVLILDRGFDRAGRFARLKERGVPFGVRLGHSTWMEPSGQEKTLRAPGQARVWRAARLRRDGRVMLDGMAVWGAEGQVPLPTSPSPGEVGANRLPERKRP